MATHFFQDLVVSLGKKGESLQDPSWIWQRSATEISKNLPRDILGKMRVTKDVLIRGQDVNKYDEKHV